MYYNKIINKIKTKQIRLIATNHSPAPLRLLVEDIIENNIGIPTNKAINNPIILPTPLPLNRADPRHTIIPIPKIELSFFIYLIF